MLSFSHGCCDLFQGAVPALLPFLVLDRGYSYGAAGALVLAASVGGSLVQPLVGIRGDRVSSPWLVPVGLVLCGLGLGLVGVVDRLMVALAATAVGGLGVAAFHPEAARWASLASGERRATGMSVFSIGGNAGFALGPLLVTPIVLVFGLGATPVIALVPLAGALVCPLTGASLLTKKPARKTITNANINPTRLLITFSPNTEFPISNFPFGESIHLLDACQAKSKRLSEPRPQGSGGFESNPRADVVNSK